MSVTAVRVPHIARTPYVGEVSVSLDEFKPEEVAEYLRGIGYQVDGTFSRQVIDRLEQSDRDRRDRRYLGKDDESGDPEYEYGCFILKSELDRAETLALCGQRDAAREYIVAVVNRVLQRPL
jgi:hypothetical protein